MWKRIITILIMLIGGFLLTTSVNNILKANALFITQELGKDATGRIGKLQQGDRIYLGTQYNNQNIISQLLVSNPNGSGLDSWLTMSEKFVDNVKSYNYNATDWDNQIHSYDKSLMKTYFNTLNQNIKVGSIDDLIILDRTSYIAERDDGVVSPPYLQPDMTEHRFWCLAHPEATFNNPAKSYSMITNKNLLKYKEDYWLGNGSISKPNWIKIVGSTGSTSGVNVQTIDLPLRATAKLNLENVVFSISVGTGSNYSSNIKAPIVNLSDISQSLGEAMKVRFRNINDPINISFNDIKHTNGMSIKEIAKGSDIVLDYSNADYSNDHIVSVIFTDFSTGDFKYYQPLEAISASNLITFETSNIASGKYKVYLVNEEWKSGYEPIYSSDLSGGYELTVDNELQLNVTPTPQSQTSFEYNKNVKQNYQIATITSSGGVGLITYSVVTDTSQSGHGNDFQKFDISTDASGKPIVIVKDVNGLDAGDYYFKVNAIDANGDPTGGVDSSTVHIKVMPTSTSVVFNDTNTTKKSITNASTVWNETATSTPSNSELKVSYSVTGGDATLVTINADTGNITYNGGTAYGKVTIRATVDDADTNKDNYTASYVEKDIVIYREVDGSVTPDSASTDSTIPTFSASDSNIKSGGTIGTIAGSKGTPDTIDGSTTTYTYDLKKVDDYTLFDVNPTSGVITAKANLGVKSYSITVIVKDKWSSKELPVTINVGVAQAEVLKFYESSSSNTIITTKSVTLTDTGASVFATVKGSTNTNPVTYKIKDGSTNVITINQTSGAVTIKGVGTVTIVAEKDGASGQAKATVELTFTVNAGTQNFIYTDQAGNELGKTGTKYSAITETYDVNKKFQLYTSGSPSGASITYALKDNDPALQDVISVDPNTGEVTILNASLSAQMGKIIVVATSHDPTGNYTDVSIELPINIEKGTRTVSFADQPIYAANGKGSITPVIHVDGVPDPTGNALISVDDKEDNTIAWTNDNKSIKYDYSEESAKDIKIRVELPSDRNYGIAKGEGTLHIMGADENVLAITSPGKIIYGDHFTIRCTQDDSSSHNVQYTFVVNNTTYISSPTITGNKAEFDALKFSGTNTVTVTVTRTADGELPLSKKVNIKVLPKDINIQVDDQTKSKGEPNPTLTYQDFTSQIVTWNGIQDVIQTGDVKLSTTAKETSASGSYPITGDAFYLNKTYPNYNFTFKNGTLTVTEENIEDHWYHLELDDGKNTPYTGNWTNQDVNIISDHSDYVNVSKDQSTWETPKITVSTEGKIEQSFWMKKDSGATTSEKKETILIDKTAPSIKTITASDTNNKLQNIINKLSGGIFFKPSTQFEITTSDTKDELEVSGTGSIAYKIYKQNEDKTYGSPMKQDTLTVTNEKAKITISDTTGTYKICVLPKDQAGNVAEKETCKELTLRKINVDVDGDGEDDFNDPDKDGCADFNIIYTDEEDGKEKVLNVDANRDGIPEMNIDSDGDGKPDINVDTDNDGKPDLNLLIMTKELWKPTKCVTQHGEQYASGVDLTPVINVELTNDNIPDINIDNNGDFKPDLNISIDGKTPYTNIYTLHEWKPNHDYTSGTFIYDSIGTDKDDPKRELNIDTDGDGLPDVNIDLNHDGKADINIDLNGDEIPDIDIDTTGDGKADTNIDTNGDGQPDENIVKITEWKPEHNSESNGMNYDTMRDLGKKDQLEDQGIVIVKPDGESFDPSYELQVEDITEHTSNVIVSDIKKFAGGQEVKQIYEVSLMKNSIRVQPNGSLKIKIPYNATIKSPKLIVEQSDGTYKLIEPDIEEGYLVYESNYLGKVAVIGDGEAAITPTDPNTDIGGGTDTQTSVKGTYTAGTSIGDNMGGASTSDSSNILMYLILGSLSFMIVILMHVKRNKAK